MVVNEVLLGGAGYSPVGTAQFASAEGEPLSFKGSSKSTFVMDCRESSGADNDPKHTHGVVEKIAPSGQD